jgi:hypothetical protein
VAVSLTAVKQSALIYLSSMVEVPNFFNTNNYISGIIRDRLIVRTTFYGFIYDKSNVKNCATLSIVLVEQSVPMYLSSMASTAVYFFWYLGYSSSWIILKLPFIDISMMNQMPKTPLFYLQD